MAFNFQKGDITQLVFNGGVNEIYPDINDFEKSGVYDVQSKPNDDGTIPKAAFTVTAENGKVTTKEIPVGVYMLNKHPNANGTVWHFSRIGFNSDDKLEGSGITVTYDKNQKVYTITDDELSGGDTPEPTPSGGDIKIVDFTLGNKTFPAIVTNGKFSVSANIVPTATTSPFSGLGNYREAYNQLNYIYDNFHITGIVTSLTYCDDYGGVPIDTVAELDPKPATQSLSLHSAEIDNPIFDEKVVAPYNPVIYNDDDDISPIAVQAPTVTKKKIIFGYIFLGTSSTASSKNAIINAYITGDYVGD